MSKAKIAGNTQPTVLNNNQVSEVSDHKVNARPMRSAAKVKMMIVALRGPDGQPKAGKPYIMKRAGSGFDDCFNAPTTVNESAHIIATAEGVHTSSDVEQRPNWIASFLAMTGWGRTDGVGGAMTGWGRIDALIPSLRGAQRRGNPCALAKAAVDCFVPRNDKVGAR
jgi:hypothetical protein